MYRLILSAVLTMTVLQAGCGADDIAIPAGRADTLVALTKDDSVVANCETVRLALEAFGADNGGMYPETKWSAGSNGKYIVEYLPGGTSLLNPYRGGLSEPTDGESVTEGETGYVSAHDDAGDPTGYIISGTGGTPGEFIYYYFKKPLGQE